MTMLKRFRCFEPLEGHSRRDVKFTRLREYVGSVIEADIEPDLGLWWKDRTSINEPNSGALAQHSYSNFSGESVTFSRRDKGIVFKLVPRHYHEYACESETLGLQPVPLRNKGC